MQNSAIYQYISTVHSDTQVFFVYMYSCCFWDIVLMLFILFVCFFMVNTPCRISFNLATMQLSKIWLYAFKNNNIVHAEPRKPCKTNGNRNNMQWNTGVCEFEKTDMNKNKKSFYKCADWFLNREWVFQLFICLFGVFFFCPTWEFFTHMEMSPLPEKAHTQHSCPLSSEGSLTDIHLS